MFRVGDNVKWCDNPYTIVKIMGDEVLLKQRFSIGTILKPIKIKELSKDN